MIIFKKEQDIRRYLAEQNTSGKTIGFIPTMGALHAGHLSLIREAKLTTDIVVCSIFVNPTQFNDKSDFEKYPVSPEEDIEKLLSSGCDIAFMPETKEMYPDNAASPATYGFGYLDTILEGAKRPGHFKGVGQIVARLLDVICPQYLFLGQKDYQQCLVIKKLLELTRKSQEIKVIICPTIREADGLAMSSRNARLTEPQRALAATIYQCLVSIQGKQFTDKFDKVQKECIDLLRDKGLEPEYVTIATADTLDILEDFDAQKTMIALIAAKIGEVRLIDNLLLNPETGN